MKSFAVLALACVPLFAQEANDVTGWAKTKWGMSEAQVKEQYPEAKTIDGKLTIESVEIAGSPYRVVFGFTGGKVSEAVVRPVAGYLPFDAAKAYLQAITQKYGQQSRSGVRTSDITQVWTWLRPSGSIEFIQSVDVPKLKNPTGTTVFRVEYKKSTTDNI